MFNYTILVGGGAAVFLTYLAEGYSNVLVILCLLVAIISMMWASVNKLAALQDHLQKVNMGLGFLIVSRGLITEEELKQEVEESDEEAA